jgi:hypothetical protein
MNARQYGSIENRHRMFFGLVRPDIHDKLGPMLPPMPTNTSQTDMRTVLEALLPADSPLIKALIDKSSCWKRFRTPAEHEPHHVGPKMEMWCADRRCGAYSIDGLSPAVTPPGVWVWDTRIKNSDGTLGVARKLHSKEIHITAGALEELEFPEGLSEQCKIGMLGKVMNGHCVRALGAAAHSYLHQSPTRTLDHPTAFSIGGQTAYQQHCSHSTTQALNSLRI